MQDSTYLNSACTLQMGHPEGLANLELWMASPSLWEVDLASTKTVKNIIIIIIIICTGIYLQLYTQYNFSIVQSKC